MKAAAGKKIVFFIPSLGGGGAERMMVNLSHHFVRLGHQVSFVLCSAAGSVYTAQLPPGVQVAELKTYQVLPTAIKFRKYLKVNRPDYVISALEYTNAAAILANRFSGHKAKVMASVRCHLSGMLAPLPLHNRLYVRLLVRLLYRRADVVVAISEGVAKDVAALSGLAPGRIKVIYNPAFSEKIAVQADAPGPTHPWLDSGQEKVIIGVGRLIYQKDFLLLIKAVEMLRAQGHRYKLLILGEGEERPMLQEYIDRQQLQDAAALLPFTGNPFAFIKKADLFVLSSRYEGFGNVVVEALACGTPVVSTDCPSGPAEILDFGRYGYLTPVGDTAAMAAAIHQALEAPPIDKAALVARAREFNTEKVAGQYLAAFE